MNTRLSSALLPAAIISGLACSTSCTPDPVVDDNKPVELPPAPTNEPYFVSKESIVNTFKIDRGLRVTQAPEVQLKFNYSGSLVKPTRHNRVQSEAIAQALQTQELAGQQFAFIIKGKGININHRESLLNLFNYSRVNLSRFEILSESSEEVTPVVESTLTNSQQENTTTVIMRRL